MEIFSQLGIADALFSADETRAKKVVCFRRLGHRTFRTTYIIGTTVRAGYLKQSPT